MNRIEAYFEHYSHICCPFLGHDENDNLSGTQEDMLFWHMKLRTSMYKIQENIRDKSEQTSLELGGSSPRREKLTSGYHNYSLEGINFWYMYFSQEHSYEKIKI